MDGLRVMTFNVRYDTASDGRDAWPHRRRLVASTVRFHGPDVVGIQEAMAHQMRELEELLPGYDWVGDPRDSVAAGGEHTAVGVRTDRFECVATETFWLSETPETPGSVGWDARYPRVATHARLQDRRSDQRLLVLNTHLDHEGERARRAGIELVLDRFDAAVGADPGLVMGDFNCVVGDPAHAAAVDHELPDGRRLFDTRGLATHRHGPTTTRSDFHDLLPDMGIDHVFVTGEFDVATHAVCTDRDDDHYASDHFPVVVDCTL
ncbi:endonuclease/exonuclease/phosphatase family protein [Halomicroarcula sp. GCM10025817]|uniref:endonuclease/exonuclease/phosphatase family protein n=1 Tax=Haloarcula TaxID=2237 RepID=UPI0023E7F9FD|nr:endonuclease/exonuclease/phosphatase family protein [Halomicroarcula sp. SYNS111]